MKLLPILALAVLVTTGCSSMQTSPVAMNQKPLSPRASAEQQLHAGMMKLLADAEKPVQQDFAVDALSTSPEYVANAK